MFSDEQATRAIRYYGFSSTLNLSMPLFQGFCGAVAIIYALQRSYKYWVIVLFMCVSIGLNARVGFIFIPLAGAFYLASLLSKQPFKFIIMLATSLIVLYISYEFIMNFESRNPDGTLTTLGWAMQGVKQYMSLLSGDKVGGVDTLSILFGQMFHFPSGIDLLLGTGKDAFYAAINSDIGYINYLYYGGIVLITLFLAQLSTIAAFVIQRERGSTLVFFLLALTLLLVGNLKGRLFEVDAIFAVLVFYYLSAIIKNKNVGNV